MSMILKTFTNHVLTYLSMHEKHYSITKNLKIAPLTIESSRRKQNQIWKASKASIFLPLFPFFPLRSFSSISLFLLYFVSLTLSLLLMAEIWLLERQKTSQGKPYFKYISLIVKESLSLFNVLACPSCLPLSLNCWLFLTSSLLLDVQRSKKKTMCIHSNLARLRHVSLSLSIYIFISRSTIQQCHAPLLVSLIMAEN